MPHEPPLSGVSIYNPGLLSHDALVNDFVVRLPILDALLEDLRAGAHKGGASHHLILGMRGMGKTTLLHRLRYALEDDPELSQSWWPLKFPEEQYNVSRLGDLWLNCLDALIESLEERRQPFQDLERQAEALRRLPEEQLGEQALALLLSESSRLHRRFVLLLDNVDLVFSRLESSQWALRRVLSEQDSLRMVGASAAAMESTYSYGAAFYDFFAVHELPGLRKDEVLRLLDSLAKRLNAPRVRQLVAEDPGRIETVRVLSGGNPRTITLLFQVLQRSETDSVRGDIEQLLDSCTPLYKHRFEQLSSQAQQVVHGLAVRWHPCGSADLASDLRLPSNTVTAQLDRLVKDGVVQKVPLANKLGLMSKTGYQISERFFNIWYLMRENRRVRQRLLWLVEFLRMLNTPEQHRSSAKSLLERKSGSLREVEWSFAVAQLVPEPALKGALEHHAVSSLAMVDHSRNVLREIVTQEQEDVELCSRIERVQRIKRLRARVQDPVVWDRLFGVVSWTLEEREGWVEGYLSGEDREGSLRILEEEHKRAGRTFGTTGQQLLTRLLREGFAESVRDARALLAAQEAQELWRDSRIVSLIEGVLAHEDTPRPLEERLAAVRRAVLVSPDASPLVLAVCLTLRSISQLADAIEHLEQAAQAGTEDPAIWRALGEFLCEANRHEDAEQAVRHAVSLDENSALSWVSLGFVLLRSGRWEESENATHKALELDPELAIAWNNLAWARLVRGEEPAAVEGFIRKAIELDADVPLYWFSLGTTLSAQAQWRASGQAFARSLELAPESVESWVALGEAYTNDEWRDQEAIPALRRALELEPQHAQAHLHMGRVLSRRAETAKDAEQHLRAATSLNPQNASAWRFLGNLLAEQPEHVQEAEHAYRRALELAPGDTNASAALLSLLWTQPDRLSDAENVLQNMPKDEPTFHVFWSALACYHLELNNSSAEALRVLRYALDLRPDSDDTWRLLGVLLVTTDSQTNLAEAEAAFRRAISLKPTEPGYWKNLGDFLLDQHRPAEALPILDEALRLAPEDPDLKLLSARAHLALGDLTQAAPLAEDALRLTSNQTERTEALLLNAEIALRQGTWPQNHVLPLMTQDDLEVHWDALLDFYSTAVSAGHAQAAAATLDESGTAERWLPLRTALLAVGNKDFLYSVAPEVREPTERVLARLLKSESSDA